MNIFEMIKTKYNLETNIKGIEYIDALEKEVAELITEVNRLEEDNYILRIESGNI